MIQQCVLNIGRAKQKDIVVDFLQASQVCDFTAITLSNLSYLMYRDDIRQ